MKLTKTDIEALNPCRDGLEFCKQCDFDIVKIYNTCERGDWLVWLLRRTVKLEKSQSVQIAIECAKMVLYIYEKKNPNDKRPRLAIEAAENWIKNPSEENRLKSHTAYAYADAADAAAAAAAAYAAAAAAAAADAAYAAYAAAAAAAAADAAYAAYAADAADADARKELRQKQADKIREIIPCPFTN